MSEQIIKPNDAGNEVFVTVEHPVRLFTITLSEHVSSNTKDYYEFLHLLYDAGDKDVIVLKMGNYGGALEQCIKICNALKTTAAHVIVNVDAPCYSAGSIISCCGDQLLFGEATMLMFHNYSGSSEGKAGEATMSVEAHNKIFRDMLESFCSPFLTKKEINQLVRDQDTYVYSTDTDLQKRIERHFK